MVPNLAQQLPVCPGLPREALTSISVTKAWELSKVVGAGAVLARPRAWESSWSSTCRRGPATGSRSALWTSPSRRLLQLLGRLFCNRTNGGGWWCGGSLQSLSVCPQAHVNGPTAPTSMFSMGKGRKGDMQMGGNMGPLHPSHRREQSLPSLCSRRPGGAITHCNRKVRHRHCCASKHWGNRWQHRDGTQPSLLQLWPPDSIPSHSLHRDGHPQIALWWDMEGTWRMSSAPPCPLHVAPLTSSCVIFSLGSNPSHRSRSWVSSGTKGKEPKNRRYTCTRDGSGAAGHARSRGTSLPSNAPAWGGRAG